VKSLRSSALLAAAAITVLLAIYMGMVAERALIFIRTDDAAARGLGAALMVLPFIGAWWLWNEWRLGTTVQRMATRLEDEGRILLLDGPTAPSGRLTDGAAEALFETARRGAEADPESWEAWFHVAQAYDAARDRRMARKSLRYAAELFRAERKS